MSTARQLCDKYLDSTAESTVEGVLRGVARLGGEVQRGRGVRELVAAVLYCQHSQAIRLKLKEFARMNQLNPKLFNRKYVAYQTVCKRLAVALPPNQPPPVKQEHHEDLKFENDMEKEEEDDNDTYERMPPSPQPMLVASPKEAIELIFDGVFKSSCFQDCRREMITKMTDRCTEIDPQAYEHMTWTTSRSLKLFYLIYARLKQLGMSVGFTRYREAVAAAAGYELQLAHAYSAIKILRMLAGEDAEERWGEVPRPPRNS